jgi:hypothetical protein
MSGDTCKTPVAYPRTQTQTDRQTDTLLRYIYTHTHTQTDTHTHTHTHTHTNIIDMNYIYIETKKQACPANAFTSGAATALSSCTCALGYTGMAQIWGLGLGAWEPYA